MGQAIKNWNWDRILLFSCLGVIFFVLLKDCSRDEPKNYDGYIQEFNQEIEQVKKDVKFITDNLEKQYQAIDPATKSEPRDIFNDYFRTRKR